MFREVVQLISNRTGFAIGAQLQAGHASQNAPVRMVLVQENGGATTFGHPDMIDLMIQTLVRAPTYFQAREDSYTAYNALHSTSGWNMPRLDGTSGEDYLVMTIEALSAPQYLGIDDNRRHLFSTNYVFRIEEGSCTENESGA